MPGPVSETVKHTNSSRCSTVSRTCPSAGVNLRLLPSRFESTWRMRSLSCSNHQPFARDLLLQTDVLRGEEAAEHLARVAQDRVHLARDGVTENRPASIVATSSIDFMSVPILRPTFAIASACCRIFSALRFISAALIW